MEIYHRSTHHTRFTSARCDDTQDAQKVSYLSANDDLVLRKLHERGSHHPCGHANQRQLHPLDHYVS